MTDSKKELAQKLRKWHGLTPKQLHRQVQESCGERLKRKAAELEAEEKKA